MSEKSFTNIEDAVESLIRKAANAFDENEAMKYSQAALNSANALCALAGYKANITK